MKWKPINTVGAEELIIIAQISDAGIEQLTWVDDGFPLGSGACGWTHWCEQPEIPHPAELWPVDAKVSVGSSPDILVHRRHFKEYRDGKFFVFDGGFSSWTGDKYQVSGYTYARLAEDGE